MVLGLSSTVSPPKRDPAVPWEAFQPTSSPQQSSDPALMNPIHNSNSLEAP